MPTSFPYTEYYSYLCFLCSLCHILNIAFKFSSFFSLQGLGKKEKGKKFWSPSCLKEWNGANFMDDSSSPNCFWAPFFNFRGFMQSHIYTRKLIRGGSVSISSQLPLRNCIFFLPGFTLSHTHVHAHIDKTHWQLCIFQLVHVINLFVRLKLAVWRSFSDRW